YQRLVAEGFQAPPAAPLGQRDVPPPFSWTAASRPEPPVVETPSVPAPPVHPVAAAHKPTGITGRVVPGEVGDETIVTSSSDRDLDKTVVVSRAAAFNWVLELPDGSEAPLQKDTIVGRRPSAIDGAYALAIPDASRTLSKN